MKIKSLSDLPGALFYPLKEWTEQSIGNFNLFIGLGFLFIMASAALVLFYTVKIGKSDERTTKINLTSCYCMLMSIVICDIIFPKDYLINQFFMLKYGIAFFVSGIYLLIQYRKDFK
ncbi:DUF2178 domain-containing protein [Isobaculum melis]|uniref:DUF2178 domain-containing protein n=1 Tax=Isobaculum melis TaxID=142588 RepID=A0A1H9PVD8_9LACT|nr:DUF2178 domain-containing protein [Isobaculum melis]SER52078.1 hypothetical protein SAMN04488559_101161 [Isobaculum melis]